MRYIEFQEVGMENYGPYIEPLILTFTNNTITLLTGKNGVGKTTALDALPFTLFGITSKKDAKGDDLVNRRVGKNCKTWVKFKSGDDQYIVTRYQKYTKLQNTVIINKNGVDIKKGQREALPEIEKLICSKNTFMNTIMFGQKVKDFFTDLTDSDKKEIFRKILNLDQYVLYYKEVDNRLKVMLKTKESLISSKNLHQGLLENVLEQINLLTQQKNKFNKDKIESLAQLKKSKSENEIILNGWIKKLEELKSQDIDVASTIQAINNIDHEITNISSSFKNQFNELEQAKQTKIAELKQDAQKVEIDETANYSKAIEELANERNKLREKQFSIKTEISDNVNKIDIEINSCLSRIESIRSSYSEIEERILNDEVSACPTCEQEVSKSRQDLLLRKVENKKTDEENINNTIKELEIKRQSVLNEGGIDSARIVSDIKSVENQINQLKAELSVKVQDINQRLSQAITKVNELSVQRKKELIQKIDSSSKELTSKKVILESKKNEQNEIISKIDSINSTADELKKRISSIDVSIDYKENEIYDETQLISYYSKKNELERELINDDEKLSAIEKGIIKHQYWKTAFSPTGIPSMLIDESIPFMNDRISHYLNKISNGRYVVSFDTLAEIKTGEFRDKISVRVVDTNTQADSRVLLSGGQTRIVDIATILTLGELQSNINNVKFNILLFDEIFDSLDYENVGYVSKVLHSLKENRAIYIISHQHEEQLEQDIELTLT